MTFIDLLQLLFFVFLAVYLLRMLILLRREPPFSILADLYGGNNSDRGGSPVFSGRGYLYLKYKGETYSAALWQYELTSKHLHLSPVSLFKPFFFEALIPRGEISIGKNDLAFGFLPVVNVRLHRDEEIKLMVPRRIANQLKKHLQAE